MFDITTNYRIPLSYKNCSNTGQIRLAPKETPLDAVGLPMEPLKLTEKHEELRNCILEYPCLLEVFDNIKTGLPLEAGIKVSFMKTLNVYIENLFIPLMEKAGIIKEDTNAPNGYVVLVDNIIFESKDIEGAEIAHKGMADIISSFEENDSPENTLFAYVSGEDDISEFTSFLQSQRQLLKDQLMKPDKKGPNSRKYRIALGLKIEREKDQEGII